MDGDASASDSASASLSSRRKAMNRAKRKVIHDEREAARPPQKRMMTRPDFFDVYARPQMSQLRLDAFASMMEWFDEFSQEKLQLPEGDSKKYFSGPTSPILTEKLIRMFLYWITDSRYGSLRGSDKSTPSMLSLVTMIGYTNILFGAIAYHARSLETEVRQQVIWWVKDNLVKDQGLNLETRKKPVAYANDVSCILRKLFEPLMLCTFASPRQVWYTCLFINLAVDSCGRIGEIVTNNKYKDQYLRWGDCEFWAHRDKDGSLTFSAIITFHWLKGRRRKPNEYKSIPLRLLPPHLAFEDTLRQLLLLALAEGHFDGLDSWQDLQNLDASPDGSIIPIKESSKKLAVLRKVGLKGRHDLEESNPLDTTNVTKRLALLGQAAGFRDKLGSYCLRRGVFFVLESATSPAVRRFMMGHSQNGDLWPEYAPSVSTVDFQSISRGLEPAKNIHLMGSMSMGKRDSAPKTISESGLKKVRENQELRSLSTQLSEASDSCRLKHRTIKAAKEAGDNLYQAYYRLQMTQSTLYKRLVTETFEEEYQNYMATHVLAKKRVGPSKQSTPTGNNGCSSEEDSRPEPQIPGASSAPESLDDRMDDLDPFWAQIDGIDSADGTRKTHPDDEIEEDSKVFLEELQSEVTRLSVKTESISPSVTHNEDSKLMRKHGIYEDSRSKIISGSVRKIVPNRLPFSNIYDEVVDGDLSDIEIAMKVVPFIKTVHPLDHYPASLMPDAGSFACRFCGKDHGEDKIDAVSSYHTTYRCASKLEMENAKGQWEELTSNYPAGPCTWLKARNSNKPCGKVFDPPGTIEHQKHIWQHVRSTTFWDDDSFHCRFEHDDGDAKVFDTADERTGHMLDTHNCLPFITPEAMFLWCPYCEDFVPEIQDTPGRATHLQQHLEESRSNVTQYGYNGVWLGKRMIIPACCMFCFHDPAIPIEDRLWAHAPRGATEYRSSISAHALRNHIDALDSSSKVYCPASVHSGTDFVLCTCDEKMTTQELIIHMRDEHGFAAEKWEAREKVNKRNRDGRAAAKSSASKPAANPEPNPSDEYIIISD